MPIFSDGTSTPLRYATKRERARDAEELLAAGIMQPNTPGLASWANSGTPAAATPGLATPATPGLATPSARTPGTPPPAMPGTPGGARPPAAAAAGSQSAPNLDDEIPTFEAFKRERKKQKKHKETYNPLAQGDSEVKEEEQKAPPTPSSRELLRHNNPLVRRKVAAALGEDPILDSEKIDGSPVGVPLTPGLPKLQPATPLPAMPATPPPAQPSTPPPMAMVPQTAPVARVTMPGQPSTPPPAQPALPAPNQPLPRTPKEMLTALEKMKTELTVGKATMPATPPPAAPATPPPIPTVGKVTMPGNPQTPPPAQPATPPPKAAAPQKFATLNATASGAQQDEDDKSLFGSDDVPTEDADDPDEGDQAQAAAPKGGQAPA